MAQKYNFPSTNCELIETQPETRFEVTFTRSHIVKASTNPMQNSGQHILNLSNLDLLSGRFPVTYFYFYRNPTPDIHVHVTLIDNLKRSLSVALEHYYPFAGRIVDDPETNEPQIVCDNSGALVTEAEANIALNALDFHDLGESLRGKLVCVRPDFPLQVQVTYYTCGGTSLTFTFDHALGDATAFGDFLVSWSEIARDEPISRVPNHHRRGLIFARDPPRYHPSIDRAFAKCTAEDIMNIPTPETLLKRLYFIDASSIDRLQRSASADGSKRTKIEAFSAHVWKNMVRAIDPEKQSSCKMGWLVDGRTRMLSSPDRSSSMSGYVGNVLSVAFGEARIDDLARKSLPEVASEVHEAISEVANEKHFVELVDWIECQRPGLMMSRVVLGQGGPAVVLSSGRRFPVAEVEFGFGRPVLGTVCSTVERISVAYMNQRPSAAGDGSWTVSAILWPEFAAVLQEDPVFQPMTARHLNLA